MCVRCPTDCCEVPNFRDWEIDGKHFAEEVSMVYLGHANFDIMHQDDIEPFLTQQLRAFGPKPFQHIRQLTVQLTLESYQRVGFSYYPRAEWQDATSRYAESVERLQPLLCVTHPVGFRLKIVVKH
jgi:hypothetical protein